MIASKQLIIFPLIIRREHWKRYSQRSFPFYRAFCKHMQAQPQKFKYMSPFLTCFPHLPFGKALRAGTHSARAHHAASSHYATRCVGAKKQSAPATSYKFWCLALATVVAAAPPIPSSNKRVFYAKYLIALSAAIAPSAQAVTICLRGVLRMSPATKTPSTEVAIFSSAKI